MKQAHKRGECGGYAFQVQSTQRVCSAITTHSATGAVCKDRTVL